MSRLLCVDIGNTSVHCALWRRGAGCFEAGSEFTQPTKSVSSEEGRLAQTLRELSSAGGVFSVSFCSVVPRAATALTVLLGDLPERVFRLTCDSCPGLEIAYPKPSEIGQDRLANAIAAQDLLGAPVVVVDMGTAVTFDIITQRGYEGGIIAPGLEVMTRYLHEQTALLPALDPNDLAVSKGIGKTTVEAMKLGCAVGFDGMIRALLERVQTELKTQGHGLAKVVATGGSAGALFRESFADIDFHPLLTLHGLAIAFERKHTDATNFQGTR